MENIPLCLYERVLKHGLNCSISAWNGSTSMKTSKAKLIDFKVRMHLLAAIQKVK